MLSDVGAVEVQLHSSLTLALRVNEWPVSRKPRTMPSPTLRRAHWIGGWVAPRSDSRSRSLQSDMPEHVWWDMLPWPGKNKHKRTSVRYCTFSCWPPKLTWNLPIERKHHISAGRQTDRHSLCNMSLTCVINLSWVSFRLGYDATSMGAWCPTFRDKVVVSSSRVETSKEEWTLKNWQCDVEKLRKAGGFAAYKCGMHCTLRCFGRTLTYLIYLSSRRECII